MALLIFENMEIFNEKEIIEKTLYITAQKMLVAAKTAPKARGVDNLSFLIVQKDKIEIISERMNKMGEELNLPSFVRDAKNILLSPVMLVIGTKIKTAGLKKCGMCGFANCDEKAKFINVPCSFNTGDLGIAVGSAVSIAMDNRADNRIMYSVGQTVIDLKLMDKDIKIAYGIPLSATGKNPFFDRAPI